MSQITLSDDDKVSLETAYVDGAEQLSREGFAVLDVDDCVNHDFMVAQIVAHYEKQGCSVRTEKKRLGTEITIRKAADPVS